MQLSCIYKNTTFFLNYSSDIIIQPSSIYILICIWLPSGMYLPCSPGRGFARKERQFCPETELMVLRASFVVSLTEELCRSHFLPCVSSCELPCGISMWGVVQSELPAPMKLQKTGGIIFDHFHAFFSVTKK